MLFPNTGASMKPSDALHQHRDAIRRVVESHHARNARVFGSVLHGADTEHSDLDILIDPTPETTLFDIGAIRHDLIKLLGVPVDVLTPNALPDRFKASVIAGARPV
jgi:predicted nucleotidyltransferase